MLYDPELLHEIIKLLPELKTAITNWIFSWCVYYLWSLPATTVNIYVTHYAYSSEIYREFWESGGVHIDDFQYDAGCGTSAFDPGSSTVPFTRRVQWSIKRNHLSPSTGKRSALFTTAVTLLFKPFS